MVINTNECLPSSLLYAYILIHRYPHTKKKKMIFFLLLLHCVYVFVIRSGYQFIIIWYQTHANLSVVCQLSSLECAYQRILQECSLLRATNGNEQTGWFIHKMVFYIFLVFFFFLFLVGKWFLCDFAFFSLEKVNLTGFGCGIPIVNSIKKRFRRFSYKCSSIKLINICIHCY